MRSGGPRAFALRLVAVLAISAAPAVGLAQTDAPPLQNGVAQSGVPGFVSPIVTLDKERLFRESAAGRAVQTRFEAASADLVAENRRLEAALEEEERSLTERRKSADPDAFRALAAEFDTRVEELRNAQDSKSRALTREREADQQRFFESAVPVLGQLMVDISAVAIVDRTAIILSFDQLDITDQAIARLDASVADSAAPTQPTPDVAPDAPSNQP